MYKLICVSKFDDIFKIGERYQLDETLFEILHRLHQNKYTYINNKQNLMKIIEILIDLKFDFTLKKVSSQPLDCYSYVLKQTGKYLTMEFCEQCPKLECDNKNKKEILDSLILRHKELLESL